MFVVSKCVLDFMSVGILATFYFDDFEMIREGTLGGKWALLHTVGGISQLTVCQRNAAAGFYNGFPTIGSCLMIPTPQEVWFRIGFSMIS